MKGDDFINRVELIFFGLGVDNCYQANIKIYDNNCLIINKQTYNGRLHVCLKPNKKYLLEAIGPFGKIIRCIYIIQNQTKYYFGFSNAYLNENRLNNIITFLLSDANYINLPITGEMILWQK